MRKGILEISQTFTLILTFIHHNIYDYKMWGPQSKTSYYEIYSTVRTKGDTSVHLSNTNGAHYC